MPFRKKLKSFRIKFVDNFEKLRIISLCMDTKDVSMIPECRNLAVLADSKVVVGAKQIRKALTKGIVTKVFLAQNADPVITEPLEAMCLANHIPYHWIGNMLDLGCACGIDVGAAAAAVIG